MRRSWRRRVNVSCREHSANLDGEYGNHLKSVESKASGKYENDKKEWEAGEEEELYKEKKKRNFRIPSESHP